MSRKLKPSIQLSPNPTYNGCMTHTSSTAVSNSDTVAQTMTSSATAARKTASATTRKASGQKAKTAAAGTRKKITRTRRTAKKAAAAFDPTKMASAPVIPVTEPGQLGRINVLDVTPNEENGVYPARVELGEPFTVTAQVFIEGRAKVGATAVLRTPRGKAMMTRRMTCVNPGLDRWVVELQAGEHSDVLPWGDGFAAVKRQLGHWTVTVEGWEDVYTTWLHDARIKVRVHDNDVENALDEGADLLERWAATKDAGLHAAQKKMLKEAAVVVRNKELTAPERLAAADSDAIHELHDSNPLRDGLSEGRPVNLLIQRPKSSFAAWYQFFPRSEGAYVDPETKKIVQGTLKTSIAGLERAKAEGFDIVYLPPIFPIGWSPVLTIRARRSASARRKVDMTPLIRCSAPWMTSRPCAPRPMSSVWKSPLTSPCNAPPIIRG